MKIEDAITLLVGVLIGCILCIAIVSNLWEHHDTIVKQGCGQYNNMTGNFEWLEK
jgi:competence protein ComGC